jgi:RNA polymerase sigma-70 factor, ECF subfamily
MHGPPTGCNKKARLSQWTEEPFEAPLPADYWLNCRRGDRVYHLMSRPESSSAGQTENDAEDIRLMRLIGRGDTAAFEELVVRHQSLVVGTVARMLGSNSEVDDIAQQVFVRVWRSAGRYVARAKFTTWLLKITRNLVFNELRRSKRRAHVPIQPDADAEELPLREERVSTPDAAALESELQTAIDDAIAQLPETQRLAVILRRYEEMTYEQIGDVLDLSVPAVKSVLFRARTELRERLAAYLQG